MSFHDRNQTSHLQRLQGVKTLSASALLLLRITYTMMHHGKILPEYASKEPKRHTLPRTQDNEPETQPNPASHQDHDPGFTSTHLDAVARGALHPSDPRLSFGRPDFSPPCHIQQPLLRRASEVSLLVRPKKNETNKHNDRKKNGK